MAHGPWKKPLDFGGNLDLEPGIVRGLFYIFSKLLNYISVAPCGRDFRGSGHVRMTCPESVLGNVASGSQTLDLLIATTTHNHYTTEPFWATAILPMNGLCSVNLTYTRDCRQLTAGGSKLYDTHMIGVGGGLHSQSASLLVLFVCDLDNLNRHVQISVTYDGDTHHSADAGSENSGFLSDSGV